MGQIEVHITDPAEYPFRLHQARLVADATGRTVKVFNGFSDDARKAITVAPDYFVWWYTTKSIGLGVVAAALAFMIGRATKRCR